MYIEYIYIYTQYILYIYKKQPFQSGWNPLRMMKSDRQALPDMSSSNPRCTPTQTRQTNAKRPPIDPTKLRLEPKITGFRIQFALNILNCRVDSGSPYFFQHLIVVLGGSRFGPTPLPNPPYGSGYPGEWMLNGS